MRSREGPAVKRDPRLLFSIIAIDLIYLSWFVLPIERSKLGWELIVQALAMLIELIEPEKK